MTNPTDEELDRIIELGAAATARPWEVIPDTSGMSRADAAYIIAAANHAVAMAVELKALRAQARARMGLGDF